LTCSSGQDDRNLDTEGVQEDPKPEPVNDEVPVIEDAGDGPVMPEAEPETDSSETDAQSDYILDDLPKAEPVKILEKDISPAPPVDPLETDNVQDPTFDLNVQSKAPIFITLLFVLVVVVIAFNNRRKIIGYIVEGGRAGAQKRRNYQYSRLSNAWRHHVTTFSNHLPALFELNHIFNFLSLL